MLLRNRRWRVGKGSGSAAGAALLLAALLLLLAWSDPRPPIPCQQPSERAGRDGWTLDVTCRGEEPFEPRALRGPARLLFGLTLDLNRADGRALESLPGIGPSRARGILAARAERPFSSLADLERVPGIGPHIAAGLAGWAHAGRPVEAGESGVGCQRGCR